MPSLKKATNITHFKLTLGGLETAGFFREFSGFSSTFNPVEDVWDNEQAKPEFAKFPTGAPEWEPITIERSLDKNMDLYKWIDEVLLQGHFEDAKKEGQIELYNIKGEAVMRFKIIDAWPCSYTISDFDYGQATTPATERVELVHAGIERIA
jgi:phage tail-like protein